MLRSAPRTARALAAGLALPVLLLATGCSSILGEKEGGSKSSSSGSAEASPTVKAARFGELPNACATLSKVTVKELVKKVKDVSGTAVKSSDTATRGGCAWNGLDGYQFKYLDVTLQRLDSDAALGTGEKRAEKAFARTLKAEESVEGAKGVVTDKLSGIGEQATAISFTQKKGKETYVQRTVVARIANVVVTVHYQGSGFAGSKEPKAADIAAGAQKAIKAALAKVEASA